MKRLMVRYRVKSDRAKENEDYIKKVFAQLKQAAPEGIRYASFKLPDGVSFVHLVSVETNDGSNPLPGLDAFKAFAKDIESRCEDQPVSAELTEVGNYRLF